MSSTVSYNPGLSGTATLRTVELELERERESLKDGSTLTRDFFFLYVDCCVKQ